MYDADPKCVEMVQAALNMGLQEKLAPVQRVFMCLVLTHSEVRLLYSFEEALLLYYFM